MNWDGSTIKRELAKLASAGSLGQRIVDLVAKDGLCAPIESEQLDYKRHCSGDDIGMAELCLDVVALHNTYGGYIVMGVAEGPQESFELVGCTEPVDIERLKNKIRDFTDERILVTQAACQATSVDGAAVPLQVLYIPQRNAGDEPVHFVKDGPGKGHKGRRVFDRGDIFFREADECRLARGAKVVEIWRCQPNPLLSEEDPKRAVPLRRIENNLPDRNVICPQVVGRRDALDHLWRWLPDDLAHVKVLAGEGGIGKTSIAYEFADQVTLLGSQPFQQLIWLSAKERQFRPFRNTYDEMVETHFASYDELVDCLCDHLAISEAEREGTTTTKKLRLVKAALEIIPSFIVIDDVDSLPEGEQRQTLEIGLLFGGTRAKMLLTTRKNVSYSTDVCYTVSGLQREEFRSFFGALQERFPSPTRPRLKEADVDRVWSASNGSPLFAESILRLLGYQSVGEAIAAWQGGSGDDVRRAALSREIQQLKPEARRVLLALALLSEASAAELVEVSGYPASKVAEAVQSLSSLFLIDAPRLGTEARARVSDTTSRLALAMRRELVVDHARLEKAIRDFRSGSVGETATPGSKTVASAILQALALERQGKIVEAIDTLQHAARKVSKDRRADLQAYEGHLYLKLPSPDIEASRKACREAFQSGCLKRRMFETWFSAEWEAGNFPGTEEVARACIEKQIEPIHEWRIRLAAALLSKAHAQSAGRFTISVLPAYLEASSALAEAIRLAPRDEAQKWRPNLEDTNEQVYRGLCDVQAQDPLSIARQVLDFVDQGDTRVKNYVRVADLLDRSWARTGKRGGVQERQNAHREIADKLSRLILERHSKYPSDDRHPFLLERLKSLQAKVGIVASDSPK